MSRFTQLFFVSVAAGCLGAVSAVAGTTTDIENKVATLNANGGSQTATVAFGDIDNPAGATLEKGTLTITRTSADVQKNNRSGSVHGLMSVVGTVDKNNSKNNVIPKLIISQIGEAVPDSSKTYGYTPLDAWANWVSKTDKVYQAALVAENAEVTINESTFADSNNRTNKTEGSAGVSNGGAFLGKEGSKLTVTGYSVFYNNRGPHGGAIDMDHEHTMLDIQAGSLFAGNSAEYHGGAIDIHSGDSTQDPSHSKYKATIADAFFLGNDANLGGAIYAHQGSYTTINGSNSVTEDTQDDAQSKFEGNQALEGGAIFAASLANLTVNDTLFKSNEAKSTTAGGADGGAISAHGIVNSNRNLFTGNNVTAGPSGAKTALGGAAVYVGSNGRFTSTNDTYSSNTSVTNGGAIYVDQSEDAVGYAVLKNYQISGNKATNGNGGGIYNGGTLVLTGKSFIGGNTVSKGEGADIYNAEGATLIVSDAHDSIDFFDIKQGPGSANVISGSYYALGEKGDVVNKGTINFTGSEIQLHNGINTSSKLTASAKKSGTVNITNSTIDLGGYGVPGEGVIYAKTVNINQKANILSHVGRDSEKVGHISAETISLSPSETKLQLVVPYAGKLLENESRRVKILDADKNIIQTEFNSYDNNDLYKVLALGNGEYLIGSCGTNAKLTSDGCTCNSGYTMDSNNKCVAQSSCGLNEEYSKENNACVCKSGYVRDSKNQCVAQNNSCGANQEYNDATGSCVCKSGYHKEGTSCVADNCGANQEYNDATGGCSCKSGYVWDSNNNCVAQSSCGLNEEYSKENNACVCKSGYVRDSKNQCVAQNNSCGANQEYNDATGSCVCKSGYEVYSGVCVAVCTGGQIRNAYGYCECPDGKVFVNGSCRAPADNTDYCPDCDRNEKNTANGWLQGDEMPEGSEAAEIQNELFEHFQVQGADGAYRKALDGLAPDVTPLVQAHATEITRRLAAIAGERFYNSMERTGYAHNGKRFYRFPRQESNLWVQGLYGKSKYDNRKGWNMDTTGLAVGFDGHTSDVNRVGLAYAYTKADGDSVGRETTIGSHTLMAYGEYNPNRFYTNWMASYTRSKYEEEKAVFAHRINADYNVDVLAGQIMFGQKMGPYVSGNWATGVIKPEVGARYVYTKQHAYTDSVGQKVGSADGHTLTGIVGAQYTIGYTINNSMSWYPEFRAALTYDFIEPDTQMKVVLPNGSTYQVKTENMDKLGIEVGAKVGLDINRKTELALEYEGLFKGDYTNHTGLASLKYKF